VTFIRIFYPLLRKFVNDTLVLNITCLNLNLNVLTNHKKIYIVLYVCIHYFFTYFHVNYIQNTHTHTHTPFAHYKLIYYNYWTYFYLPTLVDFNNNPAVKSILQSRDGKLLCRYFYSLCNRYIFQTRNELLFKSNCSNPDIIFIIMKNCKIISKLLL